WKEVTDFAFERYFRRASLIGTAETCLQTVNRLRSIGVDEIACLMDFGVDTDSVLESLHRLEGVKERSKKSRRRTGYIDVTDLRAHLKRKLPDYMTPSDFVLLDALPMLPNGKVDRRGLPGPETGGSAVATETRPPRNYVEELLVDLWAAILGRD